jgi:hypothetical protein
LYFTANDGIHGNELWVYGNELFNSDKANEFGNSFKFFPNPAQKNFYVDLGGYYSDVTVKIRTIDGHSTITNECGNTNLLKVELNGDSGLYLIEINTKEGKRAIFKIMKN